MNYASTDTDRRLANIIGIGTIESVDPGRSMAKVSMDGVLTDWIPWATPKAGQDRSWHCPSKGEQVVVAAPSGELADAVIIGSLYQDAHPEPADNGDISRTVYGDGTVVEYDRAAHQMKIDVSASSGSVLIVCETATVQAADSVLIDAPETTCTGNLTVEKMLTYLGGMTGSNSAGGAAATVSGGVSFEGGALTHNGKNVGSTHSHGGGPVPD